MGDILIDLTAEIEEKQTQSYKKLYKQDNRLTCLKNPHNNNTAV